MDTRTAFSRILAVSLLAATAHAQAVTLLSETFDNVNFNDQYNTHERINGVPTINGVQAPYANGPVSGADNDWYAARFEYGNGYIDGDVGVQEFGGGISTSNGGSGINYTPVGLAEDDSGLLINIDTTGYSDITLDFDWRTFSAGSGDQFVVGYFVGDLDGLAGGFNKYREIDLRNANQGGTDGVWNWNPATPNYGAPGNAGDWNELLRGDSTNNWSSESYNLNLADDAGEVWIAFWLDNGNGDYGKFDNVTVTGVSIVPVPAAAWLFASGLVGLVGAAYRKKT